MVTAIRDLEMALGDGRKRPQRDEEGERIWARRSVYAARSLGVGAVLEARDLKVVRPALGLPPAALADLVGRRLGRALEADEPVRPEDCA
jgi:N,N'-diacetyllegionaminate synthase